MLKITSSFGFETLSGLEDKDWLGISSHFLEKEMLIPASLALWKKVLMDVPFPLAYPCFRLVSIVCAKLFNLEKRGCLPIYLKARAL